MTTNETTSTQMFTVEHARRVAIMFKDDGHTLWTAEGVASEADVPVEVAKQWERSHQSDGSYKGSIWTAGSMVEPVRAVYSLDAVETIAHALGITSQLRGRAFRCRALCQQILEATEAMPPSMGIKGVKSDG